MSPTEGNEFNDRVIAAEPPTVDMTEVPARAGARIAVLSVALAVLLLVGFFLIHARKSAAAHTLAEDTAATAAQPLPVDVVSVEPSSATEALALPGETTGWYESTVYVRVSGYIKNWKADIGDKVKKGELLCEVDTPELDADLAAAQAKFNVSQASVKVEKANEQFAKTTYERWWQSPKGYVSEQEKQQKKAEYDSATAKVAAADAQMKLDQASVDRLKAMEDFKRVVAPYDGVITQRRIDIGDLVTAGSTSTTPLYAIAQADRIRTFVDVPQHIAREIEVGMPAEVITDQIRDRRFTGLVARTSSSINPASRTLRVEVDIPNSDLALMPGMYVRASFQIAPAATVQIPASALLFRQAGPQAAVVDADNHVNFRSVTIAHDEGDVVQIASGLKLGDRVALNISSEVADGDIVLPQTTEPVLPSAHTSPVANALPVQH